jgi:predicted amidohydrolase
MSRFVNVAIGQLGPIAKHETRAQVVHRLSALMLQAHQMGCDLIVYPELALTTFFPRWYIEDEAELNAYYEREMPGPETQGLFDLSRKLGIGFYIGYGELAVEEGRTRRYNTSIIVDKGGKIVGKYRKVHLPGMKSTSRGAPSSTWKSATSKRARTSRSSRPLVASSAWPSATTGAGPRPTVRWACRVWR